MSEHQYVAFRAIDGPVSKEALDFMERQSSRAEITPWSFDNEYHYGQFRGNTAEMLRRGYDFHLQYANYGIRNLMIRLPNGLPDAKAAAGYLEQDSLYVVKDNQGSGGILCIIPFIESGELDDIWKIDDLVDRLLPLRAEILEGDLRPLYLAHLAVACDGNHDPDEEKDAPVPAGLGELTNAQRALAEFYGLSDALIAAAAQNSPSLPESRDSAKQYVAWLKRLPQAKKTTWLAQLMADPGSAVRREILAEFHKTQIVPSWPTVILDRTIAELRAASVDIERDNSRKSAERDARQRAKKLADMAADPTRTLHETEQLVKQRSTDAYQQIARLLADLQESLSGGKQSGLAAQQARKLKDKNPTLTRLTAELRRQGFLKK
jgi:hypothetical protein